METSNDQRSRLPARERTRDEVFTLICRSRDVTRGQLVELTGLPSTTVSSAIARLLADGRIEKSRSGPKGAGTGSGRPAAVLNAVHSGDPVAGIDFSHDQVQVAIGGVAGQPAPTLAQEVDTDAHAAEALDLAATLLLQLQADCHVPRLSAVGVGLPGPIDGTTRQASSSTILSGWPGLDPRAELRHRLAAPVVVENDAALGALGEVTSGAGQGHRNLIYVRASNGIGAGLVVDGDLYTGTSGIAGEIGHTPIAGRTELCRCGGRGCLESVISARSILDQVAHTHPQLDRAETRLADLNDTVTDRLLEEAGRMLGEVLASVANLLNPSLVLIGGTLGSEDTPFVDGVRASIRRYCQPAISTQLDVFPAGLGARSELIGALELARRESFQYAQTSQSMGSVFA